MWVTHFLQRVNMPMSDSEKKGCIDLLEVLSDCDLYSLADTVTNKKIPVGGNRRGKNQKTKVQPNAIQPLRYHLSLTRFPTFVQSFRLDEPSHIFSVDHSKPWTHQQMITEMVHILCSRCTAVQLCIHAGVAIVYMNWMKNNICYFKSPKASEFDIIFFLVLMQCVFRKHISQTFEQFQSETFLSY